jgi:HK97 gp10 family phage protein
MAKSEIRLVGDREFVARTRDAEHSLGRMDRTIASISWQIARVAKANAPRDSGKLARSIRAQKSATGRVWLVVANARNTDGAYYGMAVEYGTSRMGAQPYVRPAIASVMPRMGPTTIAEAQTKLNRSYGG